MAGSAEDDVGSITFAPLEVAAVEMAVRLHVSDHGFDGRATSELALDDAEHAALLARDEDATRVGGVMAAISLVDIAAFNRTAGEPLGRFDDGGEGVAVIRVTGHRLGVPHELAGGGSAIGRDDRGLDAELVGCAGLAFADALDRIIGIRPSLAL